MKIREIKTFIKSFFTKKYEYYVKIFDIWCGSDTQFNEYILGKLRDEINFQAKIGSQMVGTPEILKIKNEIMYIIVWFKLPR